MMATTAGGVFDIEIHDIEGSDPDQDQSDDDSIELEASLSFFTKL